jgi:hypothetical protein
MLGVTIRFDTYHDAEEHLCHILDVEVNSPADLAGLIPEKDYLLGFVEFGVGKFGHGASKRLIYFNFKSYVLQHSGESIQGH